MRKPFSEKFRENIYITLIILGFLASLFILTGRVKIESRSKTVDIAVDYNDIESLCKQEHISFPGYLAKLKEAGVTSVAFDEVNLEQMPNHGQSQVYDWF